MKKGKEFYVIFDCSHETAAEILKQVRGGRKRKGGQCVRFSFSKMPSGITECGELKLPQFSQAEDHSVQSPFKEPLASGFFETSCRYVITDVRSCVLLERLIDPANRQWDEYHFKVIKNSFFLCLRNMPNFIYTMPDLSSWQDLFCQTCKISSAAKKGNRDKSQKRCFSPHLFQTMSCHALISIDNVINCETLYKWKMLVMLRVITTE